MSRSRLSTVLMIFAFTNAAQVASGQETVPLPTLPSAEALQRITLLPAMSNPLVPALTQEAQSRRAAFRQSVSVFQRQGLWPIRVQTASGLVYLGQITAATGETFDLLDRQANHTVTLAYSALQEITIPKHSQKTKIPLAQQNTLERTGEVIGIILMVPVRILELFLVPQC